MKHRDTHESNQHVVIQKRNRTACRYCRQEMDPGSAKAKQACPARMAHDDAGHPTPPTAQEAADATPHKKRGSKKKHANAT